MTHLGRTHILELHWDKQTSHLDVESNQQGYFAGVPREYQSQTRTSDRSHHSCLHGIAMEHFMDDSNLIRRMLHRHLIKSYALFDRLFAIGQTVINKLKFYMIRHPEWLSTRDMKLR